MKKCFVISGLGVDETVFKTLDFGSYTPRFIQWKPVQENETLSEYVQRLSLQISEMNPVLIGLSFGGIIAQELALQLNAKQIILLASVKSRKDIPFFARLLNYLPLHRIIPWFLISRPNFITYWFFGIKTKKDKIHLRKIFAETDERLFRWSVSQLVKWKEPILPKETMITLITGSNDHLLPPGKSNPDFKIPDAGHFFTVTHAREVSVLLNELLK